MGLWSFKFAVFCFLTIRMMLVAREVLKISLPWKKSIIESKISNLRWSHITRKRIGTKTMKTYNNILVHPKNDTFDFLQVGKFNFLQGSFSLFLKMTQSTSWEKFSCLNPLEDKSEGEKFSSKRCQIDIIFDPKDVIGVEVGILTNDSSVRGIKFISSMVATFMGRSLLMKWLCWRIENRWSIHIWEDNWPLGSTYFKFFAPMNEAKPIHLLSNLINSHFNTWNMHLIQSIFPLIGVERINY